MHVLKESRSEQDYPLDSQEFETHDNTALTLLRSGSWRAMTSTVQSAQADVLSQIFQGLKNKSHEVRLESSVNLRRYVNFSVISDVLEAHAHVQVATTVAEMTPDAAAKLWDDNINRRLFDLMHSQNTTENFGGLLAIGASLAIIVLATRTNTVIRSSP